MYKTAFMSRKQILNKRLDRLMALRSTLRVPSQEHLRCMGLIGKVLEELRRVDLRRMGAA